MNRKRAHCNKLDSSHPSVLQAHAPLGCNDYYMKVGKKGYRLCKWQAKKCKVDKALGNVCAPATTAQQQAAATTAAAALSPTSTTATTGSAAALRAGSMRAPLVRAQAVAVGTTADELPSSYGSSSYEGISYDSSYDSSYDELDDDSYEELPTTSFQPASSASQSPSAPSGPAANSPEGASSEHIVMELSANSNQVHATPTALISIPSVLSPKALTHTVKPGSDRDRSFLLAPLLQAWVPVSPSAFSLPLGSQ